MPTSVRLDLETEALLKRLARSSGRSKSEVIREALHHMAAEVRDPAADESLYHAVADLVGIADDGPEDLARQHKQHFRKKLNQQQR